MSQDLLRLENQLCFGLVVATRKVISAYREPLEPLSLTHPQYLAMLALWERSPRSLGELARALAVDAATLSPLLKRLESRGLITRARREGDERTLDVELTAEGRELRTLAEQVPLQIAAMFRMSTEELVELRSSLQQLIASADDVIEGREGSGAPDSPAGDL